MPDSVHAPWGLIVCLAIVTVFCFYIANARLNNRLKQTAVSLLIFTVALAAIRIFFPTNIERVEQATRDLCQSAVDGNWTVFKSFLAPDITIAAGSVNPIFSKPDQVAIAAKYTCDTQHVTTIKIIGMKSTQIADTITTLCKIITIQDSTAGQPVPSTWSLEWRRTGHTWFLVRVTLTDIGGQGTADFPDISRLKTQ
jgi:hypothetical protein